MTKKLDFELGPSQKLLQSLNLIRQQYTPGADMLRPPFCSCKITASCWYDGKLTGLCEVRPLYNTIRIFIDRSFRRMGIGQRLFSMVFSEAKAQGIHFLIAIINPENPGSNNLFKKFGFSPIGTIYFENLPYDGLGINQKSGMRVVKIIALDYFGVIVSIVLSILLKLMTPLSIFVNQLVIVVLKRADLQAVVFH